MTEPAQMPEAASAPASAPPPVHAPTPAPSRIDDEAAVDLLEELVSAPSLSGEETLAVTLLVLRMRELGFDAHVDAAGNAVGVIGTGSPHMILLGHIDTVSGVVPVRREAGRLYGRGSVDAKGPLVAFVVASARAAAAGRLGGRVTVIGCVEEEVASSRGAHQAATLPAPDACIIGEPSRWDRITLGYKGYLRARLSRVIDAGHGAHDRASAAAQACRLGVHLEARAAEFDAGRTSVWERLLVHVSRVSAGSDGLQDRAELDLVLRLPAELPPDAAQAWLTEHAAGWTVACEGGLSAWDGPRTTSLHRALSRAIASQGGRARFVRKTGTADLNVVAPAWGCPALAYGPGDASLDHTPDEHIEIAEFLAGVAVLEHLLANPAWAAPAD